MSCALKSLSIAAAFLFAGCGALGLEKSAKDPSLGPPASMNYPPAADQAVAYTCENGAKFKAIFSDNNGTVRIEPQNGVPATLYIAVTGSGFDYRDGGHDLRGKGDEAMWTEGNKPATKCNATPAG